MVTRVNHVERLIQQAMCKLDGAPKNSHSRKINKIELKIKLKIKKNLASFLIKNSIKITI
jgi:hypothetical protein